MYVCVVQAHMNVECPTVALSALWPCDGVFHWISELGRWPASPSDFPCVYSLLLCPISLGKVIWLYMDAGDLNSIVQ